MARFEITAPDGKVFDVEGPEGSTAEQALAQVQAQYKPPGAIERQAGAMALDGMSGTEKFLAGAGKGMTDVGRGLGQLVGLTDQASVDSARNRDKALADTGAGFAGELAGNVALTAIPFAGLQGQLGRATATLLPRLLAPAAAAAATGAGISALTTPTSTGESRGTNAAIGAAGGAAGDVGARIASRVVQPIVQSPAVQRLLGEGVVPTPGQATGANSIWGRVEQKLQSVPLVGDIIRMGRDRANTEFNQAAINRALPIGNARTNAAAPGVGRAGIEQADRILSEGYDSVLNRIGPIHIMPDFHATATAAIHDPDLALSQPMQARLQEIINTQIIDRAGVTGSIPAQLAKRADSNLGMMARNYAHSADADQRMLARGIRDVQTAWRSNITANATPGVAADLQELNRAFANFVRVERAAGMTGAREGVFSPAQLQSAVRATDSSARHGQFAQGHALMQDLTDAGGTLSQTVPNSGSVDRALIAAGLGGTAAGANEYFGGPGYLSALAAAPLLYSRAGSRYAVGNLIPGQQTLADIIRSGTPYVAMVGRETALQKERAKTQSQ